MAGSKAPPVLRLHDFGVPAAAQLARHVRIKSPGSARRAGDAAQLSDDRTRPRTMVEGVQLARTLAATHALAPYVGGEYRPGPDVRRATTTCSNSRRTPGARSSIRRARARWGRRGPAGGRRSPSSASTASRPPRRRLRHHAHARVGQHQRAGGDDRREGRGSDAGRIARAEPAAIMFVRSRRLEGVRPCPAATPILPPSKAAIADSPSGCRPSRSARRARRSRRSGARARRRAVSRSSPTRASPRASMSRS